MTKQHGKSVASYEAVQGMIFIVRGQKVMLDEDLAKKKQKSIVHAIWMHQKL